MIRVQVNGEERELPSPLSVLALLELLGLPQTGVAAALNGQVVPNSAMGNTTLEDGDRIEIIRAVAGG